MNPCREEGVYVLMDDGARDQWRYVFIPHED